MISRQTLCGFVQHRYAIDRELRPETLKSYLRSCRLLAEWYGSDPPLAEVDADMVSGWVAHRNQEVAAKTAKRNRGEVLSVINHAIDLGLVEPMRRVRLVRVPSRNPVAWSPREVERLVESVKVTGSHAKWFLSAIAVCWDTGLRRADLVAFDRHNLTSIGRYVVTERKTGKQRICQLSPSTIKYLSPARYPLQLPFNYAGLNYWWRKLTRAAGVEHGGFQRLRRSAATAVAVASGEEAAAKFLGHSSVDLTRRYYIDQRLIPSAVHAPPVLKFG